MVHMVPRGDVLEHEESEDCACIPHTKPTEGGFIIVHNARDGRTEEPEVDASKVWTTVATMSGVGRDGVVDDVKFDQCPRCSALVWSVNTEFHDRWHKRGWRRWFG